ncbi:MAG: 3'-5' exonuclease [Candidatus Obscuribacterales bacterium]|nr:3'-5' exonuclease [Candidatus Obscuribacterales bacterium]
MPEFVALALDTTGIRKKGDQIVEIALLVFDDKGTEVERLDSLVRPDGDLSLGLEYEHAPHFNVVAPLLAATIDRRILVCHNPTFQLGFLSAALTESEIKIDNLACLGLIDLAYRFGPSDRRLAFCLKHFGLWQPEMEEDLDRQAPIFRAQAIAKLTLRYLQLADYEGLSLGELGVAGVCSLSGFSAQGGDQKAVLSRSGAHRIVSGGLQVLTNKLPPAASASIASYYQKLDEVLADGVITLDEAEALMSIALASGLSRLQIESLHQKYLRDMIRLCFSGGVNVAPDSPRIAEVARCLGIADRELKEIINQAQDCPRSAWSIYDQEIGKLAGKTIKFTSAPEASLQGRRLSLEEAFASAQRTGLSPVRDLRKSLDFLVCSQSSFNGPEAEAARKQGTQVLIEPVFWKMVGVKVD